MTDLERNTRAGALTIDALREKLKNDLSDADLKDAVVWLSRGDVRLVAPLLEEEKYELAHERIIPALRRLAGKQLSDADRANQLLDRRVNEWVGNGRNSRYLLSLRELHLINKQKPFITWGKDRSLKEDLLVVSRRRLTNLFAIACVPILLFTIGWFVQKTNTWQIYWIKQELRNYGNNLKDDAALSEIATAFYISGDFQLASQALNRITDTGYKIAFLKYIVKSVDKLGDKAKRRALFEEAFNLSTENTTDTNQKAKVLVSILEFVANVGETTKDEALLEEFVKLVSENLPEPSDKERCYFLSLSHLLN